MCVCAREDWSKDEFLNLVTVNLLTFYAMLVLLSGGKGM